MLFYGLPGLGWFGLSFKRASIVFWSVVGALLSARVVLHDQIALGDTPVGQAVAWLRTFIVG